MHTNPKRRYVPAFVRYADIDHADVGWEERAQEAHPRDNDGKRLVVTEENVSLIGRGAEARAEGARGFLRGSGGIHEGERRVRFEYCLGEVMHKGSVSMLQGWR